MDEIKELNQVIEQLNDKRLTVADNRGIENRVVEEFIYNKLKSYRRLLTKETVMDVKVTYRVEVKKSSDIEWFHFVNMDNFDTLEEARERKIHFEQAPGLSSIIWEARIVKITKEVVS